ncbi:MAG TPA: GNAT family N-acetyltransferase [Pyrinomonadaceae bacterium]|nr:GNAT family N-acetyltransferase [Pyrinomonadaceae bacterium]
MIESAHLQLIPCELKHFEAILGNEKALASMLNVAIDDDWLGFEAAREAVPYSYKYLKEHPDALGWWMYLLIHTTDRTLIGLVGYKGRVDETGMVEIGYSLSARYRLRGLATEAARALVDHAFSHPEINKVDAHTLPEKNGSVRVLEKLGMKFIGTVIDPDDGEVWHWSLRREDYSKEPRPQTL